MIEENSPKSTNAATYYGFWRYLQNLHIYEMG